MSNFVFLFLCFFFFSSRRRHTRYIGDWNSDVCSSDLKFRASADESISCGQSIARNLRATLSYSAMSSASTNTGRSEERRVGKSVDIGGGRSSKKKKKKKRERRKDGK